VKHTHCDFEIDHEKKDSHRMREAGAESVVVSSKRKFALVSVTHKESSLEEILNETFGDSDIVLAEGFHESEVPKILVESSDFQYPFPPERIQGQLIAAVTDGKESQKEFPLVTMCSRDQVELLADHLVADLPLVLSPAGNPLECSAGT
jgi:molybdopterin-guanine dinucleotide biosynthesis protein MobB